MAAYKIIYGAGPTLTREESRFGRGYGFVGMHRHPAVKELAFGTLESHLHGKNIYELEKRWMGVFSAGPEIAAFHQIGDWAVLIRISAKQTEGRLWSFEEFLLIDSDGVKSLSERQVTPAEVLLWSGPGPDGTPLWHRDSLWAEPASWYSDPLELEILSFDQAIPGGPDPGLAPFRFPACDWAVAREGTEEERTLLPAYARAQQNLLQKIRETPGGISSDGFREIFWERLTFTTFDLDPSRVLDLSFGTGEPHVWDGLWEGIHDPGRLDSPEALAWPPRLDEEGGAEPLAASRQEIEQAGWLEPLPVETPAAVPVTPKFDEPASIVTAPRGTGRIDKSRFQVAPPRKKRKQSWKIQPLAILLIVGIAVITLLVGFIRSNRDRARVDAKIKDLWGSLLIKDRDGNLTYNLSIKIPDDLPTERRQSLVNIKNERDKLNQYLNDIKIAADYNPLPSYNSPENYESFKSPDSPDISQQLAEHFADASDLIKLYTPLQNLRKANNEEKLPSEILTDLKSWLSIWQTKENTETRKNAQVGFEKLGLSEVAQGANKNIIKRANFWLEKSAKKRDPSIMAALEELSKQTGAKEVFPTLSNLLADAPIQDSKSGEMSTVAKSPLPESSAKAAVVTPPTMGIIETKGLSDRIESDFELIVEKGDPDGYFNLPEGKEVACKAMSLPLSASRLWDGQLWVSLDTLNNAFKGALEFKISGRSVRMGGEKVGEMSTDGKRFKPKFEQNFFALLDGKKLRLLSVDSNSYEVPLSNQDFIASKTPEGFVSLVTPNGMIQVQIAKEGENQPRSIGLPLSSKTSFDSAVEKAFASGEGSEQLSENIKMGAQAFKSMLWETDLIQEGGLLYDVQGLKSYDIIKDDKVVGQGNKPCPLGVAVNSENTGRQPIDTFLLRVKNFQTFLLSEYHLESEYTYNKLDRVLHGYFVELAKRLSTSTGQLPGEAPNRYFPWADKETFLKKIVHTQSLANVLGEFQVLEQGKAKEFGAMDYSGVSFQEQNHQKLNNNLRPLAKSLPNIVAFVKWADELPIKDMPASRIKADGEVLKARFNWALELAGANKPLPTTGDITQTKPDFSDPKKWTFKLVFHP